MGVGVRSGSLECPSIFGHENGYLMLVGGVGKVRGNVRGPERWCGD